MPVIRTGRSGASSFLVVLIRSTFRVLGVVSLIVGVFFFLAAISAFEAGVKVKRDYMFGGLACGGFGLAGMWVGWRLLFYMEPEDIRHVIQLMSLGLLGLLLVNGFQDGLDGFLQQSNLIMLAVAVICLWLMANYLPRVLIRILFREKERLELEAARR